MRKIVLIKRAQWHDQFILFQVARQAPRDGFDFAMMEKAARLVGLVRYDVKGEPIDRVTDGQPRPMDGIPFISSVQLEDADWEELCAKFRAHRWALFDDDIMALGHVLLQAPAIKVAPAMESGDAPAQHIEHAGNGQLPASV